MSAQPITKKQAELTSLQKQRITTARIVMSCIVALLVLLAVWQCFEEDQRSNAMQSFQEAQGSDVLQNSEAAQRSNVLLSENMFSEVASGGLEEVSSTAEASDPLLLNQAGIEFIEANEDGTILWYQSIWSAEQSRPLVSRALAGQAWQELSLETEHVMCFSSPAGDAATERLIYVCFYDVYEGCSILVEYL